MTDKSKITDNFGENYQILLQILETLKQQQTADLDKLLPLLEQAKHAYQQCQQRLQAVAKILEQDFALQEQVEQNT